MYAVTISLRSIDSEGFSMLRQASLEIISPSRQEEGCLFFDVLFDDKDPLLIRFYEAYTDKEAFDTHLKAPHTKKWLQTCMPVIDKSSIRMPESVSEHQK